MHKQIAYILILSLSWTTISFASGEGSGTQHTYFKRVEEVFKRVQQFQWQHPIATVTISLILRKPLPQVVSHYKTLFKDTADLVNAGGDGRSTGMGWTGYIGARTYLDARRLSPYLPQALTTLEKQQDKLSWEDWVSQFEGDTKLALMSIIGSVYWVRAALHADQQSWLSIYSKVGRCADPSQGAAFQYAACGFPQKIWGLDFRQNGLGFGRAYKTVAGMNMAMALFEKGYSESDSRFVINRSFVAFETADLLYDHLGITPPASVEFQWENPNRDLQAPFQEILKALRSKMDVDVSFKRLLIGTMVNVPTLLQYIPNSERLIDFNEDSSLTSALIALYTDNPREFETHVGPQLKNGIYGQRLRQLFDAAKNDVTTPMEGAQFVLKKLSGISPRDPVRWKGIF